MEPGRTHRSGTVALDAARALWLPIAAALALAPQATAHAQGIDYPETGRVDVVDTLHGTPVPDPYRWLEDVDSERTRAWVEAQNEVTFRYLRAIPERERIRERLTEVWNYERYSAPFREGGHYFFFKNDGLQDQSVLYRLERLDAEPEVLLDPNTFSEDGTVALRALEFSHDGSLLVYGTSASGSDWQEFRVRDVETGRDLEDHLRWIKFSDAAWTHDGAGFFYSRYPEPEAGDAYEDVNLNQKVYYHRIGTPRSEDVLFYERPDQPRWGFDVEVSDDGRYALIYVWQGTDERNRVYYRDLGDPSEPDLEAPVVKLLDEFDAAYRFVGNDGPVFYFRTDLDAPRYRLIAIDTRRPGRADWKTIIPDDGVDVLQSVEIINERFVAEYLHDAHSRVRIYTMDGERAGQLAMPTRGSVRSIRGERDGTEMFYAFESFLYPETIFRYDFERDETTVFRAPELDFDASRYETREFFYRSKDGTAVPIFLTYRKDIERDGTNPALLYGYGGFNISRTPRFSASTLVWLEMGGIYAQAAIRGGGEYGEAWHRAGMLENKGNVFDDFIAAAEWLIDQRYTSSAKLAIRGGSNGGLLVGAVLNQRPDLFGAALPAVGVMDMLRFHKFTIGWAWVSDYGSPEDPEMFEVLHGYSPYHNLHPAEYPATLVTTADHDDRVVPGHSFKYAARLQEMQRGDAPVLIRIQTKAGHGGGKPTAMIIEEAADQLAFLAANLGITVPALATED